MYDWKRYWRHRGVTINYDFEGLFDERLNSNKICHLSDKEDEKLLVLLGEPGIGKSNTLFAEYEWIKKNHKAIFINLRDYIDRRWLEEKITLTDDYFEWNQNNRKERVYIFLDAIDEALIQTKHNVNNILDYLVSIYEDNLFIRMTCRSSEWPEFISSRLVEILNVKKSDFEEKNILVLTPLTSTQIELALKTERINSEIFWGTVKSAKISSLTMHPYTLKMLLSLYKRDNSIPTSKKDLFSKGAEILCQEYNQTRQFYNSPTISHSDLLEIAQIIALVSIISSNLNIINSTSIEKANGYLELIKLQPQLEKKFSKITYVSLQQTLKSSLFIDIGQGLYTWSHKMICEYLAAQAIITLNIDLEVIKNLFVIRLREYVSISKEYLGVISWLLDERKDLLNFIIESQPEILFEIEFEIPIELREKVVKNIFWKISIADYKSNVYLDNKYKFLYFDGIEELIIENFEVGDNNAKLEALKIIQDCNLVKLYLFVEQASKEIKDYMVMKNIIKTLIQLAPSEKKINVLEYLELEDPDDEITGIVLNELWPNFISFKDLLKNIRIPHNTNFLGSYRSLLYNLEKRDFTVGEILDFTEYIIENCKIPDDYDLNKLTDRLYCSAIKLAQIDEYRDSIFRFIEVLLSDDIEYEIYRYLFILNTEDRRQLIDYLMETSIPLNSYAGILKVEDI
ncbi:NACHT domain-containing protein, partial [Mesobacillus zeae]